MSKALLDKDGYLFLVNDHNGVQAQTAGLHRLDKHAVDEIFAAHTLAHKRARARGAEYIHIVAPNKETAYRDFLPIDDAYERDGKTPLNQFNQQCPAAAQITFSMRIYFDRQLNWCRTNAAKATGRRKVLCTT